MNEIQQLKDRIKDLENEIESLNKKQNKYGLHWNRDKQDNDTIPIKEGKIPYLIHDCDKDIINNGNQDHLLINGDNLYSLISLQAQYKGKINVIYIDPPYNTGNKDFIYNDNFVDKEDSFGHSKWLNFMEIRLKLAKELLSDDGVIFISIDDHEQANLKLLCDSIFGEKNFIGTYLWYKSATPPNLSHKIKKNLEYIIVYEKAKNSNKYQGIKKDSSSDDPFTKPQNTMKQLTFKKGVIHFVGNDGIYKAGVYGTNKFPNKLLNDMIIKNGVNDNDVTFENKFIWVQETLDKNIMNNVRINLSKNLVLSYKRMEYDKEVPPSLIDSNVGVGTTEEAGKKLEEIIGNNPFDYPKDTSLIKYLINFIPNKDAIILDFFAGSGTTGQAVMELNKEDGGNRKCILCQWADKNDICDSITYQRLKTVITGIRADNSKYSDGLDANLRYYNVELGEVDKDMFEDDKYQIFGKLYKDSYYDEVKAYDKPELLIDNYFEIVKKDNHAFANVFGDTSEWYYDNTEETDEDIENEISYQICEIVNKYDYKNLTFISTDTFDFYNLKDEIYDNYLYDYSELYYGRVSYAISLLEG